MTKKYKNKGSVSTEAAAVCALFFPLFVNLVLGMASFSSLQSQNIELNYDAGRYIAGHGCNITSIDTMSQRIGFESYEIQVRKHGEVKTFNSGSDIGKIEVICLDDESKGDQFFVASTLYNNTNNPFFDSDAIRTGYYTQEVEQ